MSDYMDWPGYYRNKHDWLCKKLYLLSLYEQCLEWYKYDKSGVLNEKSITHRRYMETKQEIAELEEQCDHIWDIIESQRLQLP